MGLVSGWSLANHSNSESFLVTQPRWMLVRGILGSGRTGGVSFRLFPNSSCWRWLIHDTGCLGLVHWENPEGGYGEGGGRRVRIHFDIWQNQYNIVKFKNKIKKRKRKERQCRKGKIHPTECRVSENGKER